MPRGTRVRVPHAHASTCPCLLIATPPSPPPSFGLLCFRTIILFILIAGLVPGLADGPNLKSWVVVVGLAGLLGSVALVWFYSIFWPTFCTMIPYGHSGEYAGIYYSINNIFSVFGPLIYTAVVQGTNDHRLAWFFTCMPACIVSLLIICLTDFEKGKQQAQRAAGIKEAEAASTASS